MKELKRKNKKHRLLFFAIVIFCLIMPVIPGEFIKGDFWSLIDNNTLVCTDTSHNVSIGKNETTSYNLFVNGTSYFNGTVFLPDNVKASFGNTAADPDLEIYSDGTKPMVMWNSAGVGLELGTALIPGNTKVPYIRFRGETDEVGIFGRTLCVQDVGGSSSPSIILAHPDFPAVMKSADITYTHATQMLQFTTGGDLYLSPSGTVMVDSNIDGVGIIRGLNFVSDVATGTSPYATTSTTLNTNLNADLIDGKHVGTSGNTVPLLDGANTWSGNQNFGVDGTGVDVKFFGDTADFSMFWDESDDSLKLISPGRIRGTKLKFGTTLNDDYARLYYFDSMAASPKGIYLESNSNIHFNANGGAGDIRFTAQEVFMTDDVALALGTGSLGTPDFKIFFKSADSTVQFLPMIPGLGSPPVAIVFNEASKNTDFRIESDGDANMFVLDAGTDKLGIGTNTPASKLHVIGDVNATTGFATDTGTGWSGTYTVTEGVVTVRNGIIIDVDWD